MRGARRLRGTKVEPSCTKNEPAPRDLIVFGEDWGAHPSSTQHLIRHLAPGRRVVWVNSIGLRRPKLSPADLGRAFAKLRRSVAGGGAAPAAAREPAAFPLVQPLAIPMAEGTLGRAINRVLIGRTVRAAAAAAGLRRPVVWASLPSAVQALGALGDAVHERAHAGLEGECVLVLVAEDARDLDQEFGRDVHGIHPLSIQHLAS